MAKPLKRWSQLSAPYKARLKRQGVSPNTYNAGKADLRAARGHAKTPEHPGRAYRNPSRYPEYIAKKEAKGEMPAGTSETVAQGKPRPMSVATIGDSIGYPSRGMVNIHYIWVTKGGASIHNVNADVDNRIAFDKGSETEQVYPYDEANWKQLYDMVKERGFIALVQSGQYDFRITT